MDTMLNELSIFGKEMLKCEKLLFGIQEAIERSFKTKDNWVANQNKNGFHPYAKKRASHYDKGVNSSSLNNSYKDEDIKNLKKSLMSKNRQILAAETIARCHIKTANDTIIDLTNTITEKELQLDYVKDNMKNLEIQAIKYANNADRNRIQIEFLTDLVKKKRIQNELLKRICTERGDKIKKLEKSIINMRKFH
ncbi:uncharacterized protein LOC126846001 [Adelges cooleyi]|uniref:uncharacterized protein LOC126846001 n=1 Tax=Adelges cooleyi TaxID=133065 RepID=UPI002180049C|nr:uncharacterized protein LOC126846001 [Adelges cooleyi]